MRLTLRNLLEWLDQTEWGAASLERLDEITSQKKHTAAWVQKLIRLRSIPRNTDVNPVDANSVAAYLDRALNPEETEAFERDVLHEDNLLQDVVHSHLALNSIREQEVVLPAELRQKIYVLTSDEVSSGGEQLTASISSYEINDDLAYVDDDDHPADEAAEEGEEFEGLADSEAVEPVDEFALTQTEVDGSAEVTDNAGDTSESTAGSAANAAGEMPLPLDPRAGRRPVAALVMLLLAVLFTVVTVGGAYYVGQSIANRQTDPDGSEPNSTETAGQDEGSDRPQDDSSLAGDNQSNELGNSDVRPASDLPAQGEIADSAGTGNSSTDGGSTSGEASDTDSASDLAGDVVGNAPNDGSLQGAQQSGGMQTAGTEGGRPAATLPTIDSDETSDPAVPVIGNNDNEQGNVAMNDAAAGADDGNTDSDTAGDSDEQVEVSDRVVGTLDAQDQLVAMLGAPVAAATEQPSESDVSKLPERSSGLMQLVSQRISRLSRQEQVPPLPRPPQDVGQPTPANADRADSGLDQSNEESAPQADSVITHSMEKWQVCPSAADLLAARDYFVADGSAPTISLTDHCQVDVMGPARFRFEPTDEPALALDFGRAVIKATQLGQEIRLVTPLFVGRLNLVEDFSEVAIHVRRWREPGMPEQVAEPIVVVELIAVRGTCVFVSGQGSTTVREQQALRLVTGKNQQAGSLKQLPLWLGESTDNWSRSAAQQLAAELEPGADLISELEKRVTHRRVEVRAGAVANLAWLGDYAYLIDFFVERNSNYWSEVLAAARDSVHQRPDYADRLRQGLQVTGDRQAEFLHLVYGYSTDEIGQRAAGDKKSESADQLVRWLDDRELAVRILAIENLREIMDANFLYRPDVDERLRRKRIRKWELVTVDYKAPPQPETLDFLPLMDVDVAPLEEDQ